MWLRALENGELAAEQQNLQLFVAVRLEAECAEIDAPGQQGCEHEEDHLPSIFERTHTQDGRADGALH